MQLNTISLMLVMALVGCEDAGPAATDAALADGAVDAAVADAPPLDAPMFCDSETRDDPYAPGMIKLGPNGYEFKLVTSTPGPPRKGNNTWVVQISHPAPVDGLALTVVPFMPDHGHGTAVVPVITPAASGTYSIAPVNLFMTGLWSVRITARAAAGSAELDHADFLFCVNSP